MLAEVEKLDESAPDYGAVLDELLEALQRIAVLQLVGGRSDDEEFARVAPFAEQISAGGRPALLSDRAARPPRLADLSRAAHGLRDDAAADARVSAGRRGGRRASAVRARAPLRRRHRVAAAAAGAGSVAASRVPTRRAGRAMRARSRRGACAAAPDWASCRAGARSARARRGSSPTAAILRRMPGGSWQLVVPADKEHLNTQQLRARLEAALREQFGRDVRLAITRGPAVAADAGGDAHARTRASGCARRARRSRRIRTSKPCRRRSMRRWSRIAFARASELIHDDSER